MTNKYSTQYAKLNELPPSRLYAHEQVGKVRRIYAEYTADAELATTDVLYLAKLPKGSVPIAFKLNVPAQASGVIQVGWDAGAEADETADADGFAAACDVSSEIDLNYNTVNDGTIVGLANKRFADDVNIVMTATTITSGLSGDKIMMEILYINE